MRVGREGAKGRKGRKEERGEGKEEGERGEKREEGGGQGSGRKRGETLIPPLPLFLSPPSAPLHISLCPSFRPILAGLSSF